jgi:hypothetical protein
MAPRHLVDKDLLIFEVSRSHSDTPRYVGLLWTGDQTVAEILPDNNHTHKRLIFLPSAGFESTIPAIERPHFHALDGAPVGIGRVFLYKKE